MRLTSKNRVSGRMGMQIVLAVAVIIIYFLMFFLMGIPYMYRMRKEEFSISLIMLIGMCTYFLVFEIIALPMKIFGMPLHVLSYTWLAVLIMVGIEVLACYHSYIQESVKNWKRDRWNERYFWILVAALICIQLVLILINTPVYMGVRDDSYYIADVCTSVYKDSIQQYNYATGQKMDYFNGNYFLPMYPVHSAAICYLIDLHPIIENKWCSLLVMLVVCNIIYYQMAKMVFPNRDKRKIFLTHFFCFVINYNLQSYGVTTGIFYFYRLSEGKGILGNILLPCLVYFFARIVRDGKNKINWLMMFILILSSFSFAMSAMFLVPVSLTGLFGSFLLVKKQWKACIPIGICMLPCIGILLFYILMTKGYISWVIR